MVGRTRRRLAEDLITVLELIDTRVKVADKELRELVTASESTLLELFGIEPSSAARLLGDLGDTARSRDDDIRCVCQDGRMKINI
jgi:transposase